MADKTPAELALSAFGSLSVLAICVVVPYIIGFFVFFDIRYLSFFTLSEFAIFSVTPLLIITLLVAFYLSVPLLFWLFEVITSWVGRFFRSAPAAERKFSLGPHFAFKWMAAFFPAISIIVVIVSKIPLIMVFVPLCALITLYAVSRLRPIDNVIFYAAAFGLFELMVFSWGYVNAATTHQDKRSFIIETEKKTHKGSLAFVGTSSVLAFDEQDNLFLLKNDGSAKVMLGPIRRPIPDRCIHAYC